MFIKLLVIDDSRAMSPDATLNIHDPIWDEIEHAIRQLDGAYRTQVILERAESEFMVVCGGENDMYSCGLVDQSGNEFVVVDESRPEIGNVIIPCGQPTPLPNQQVIDLATVLLAAKEYAESGRRSNLIKWKGPR